MFYAYDTILKKRVSANDVSEGRVPYWHRFECTIDTCKGRAYYRDWADKVPHFAHKVANPSCPLSSQNHDSEWFITRKSPTDYVKWPFAYNAVPKSYKVVRGEILLVDLTTNLSKSMYGDVRWSPFKNSIKTQFELLDLGTGFSSDFVTFFKELFSKTKKIHIFNPSFKRTPDLGPDRKSIHLPNVGLRIPLNDQYDIVLITDIKPDAELSRFVVKGISIIEGSSDHLGEIEYTGPVYYILPMGIQHQWYDRDFQAVMFRSSDVKNVVNIDLLTKLQEIYLVEDVNPVYNLFDDWFDFISIRKQRLQNKTGRRYSLKSLEFRIIYVERKKVSNCENDPENYGFDNWHEERIEGSFPILVLTLTHQKSELEVTEDYENRFYSMTREPLLITNLDPDEAKEKRIADRRKQSLYHIHGKRMAFPRKTLVENRMPKAISFKVSYELSPEEYGYTDVFDLKRDLDREISSTGMYAISYDGTGEMAVLDRQYHALENFYNGDISNPYLAKLLFSPSHLGAVSPKVPQAYYGPLNIEQKAAVDGALGTRGIYLIQGPPGTGKTQVIAEITEQEVRKGRKVIIASESNQAVDNAFDRLYHSAYIRLLRIISDKKRFSNPYSINNILTNFYRNISEHLQSQIENLPGLDDRYQILNEDLAIVKKHLKRLNDLLKFGFGGRYALEFDRELNQLCNELGETRPSAGFTEVRVRLEKLEQADFSVICDKSYSSDDLESDLESLSAKNEELLRVMFEEPEVYDSLKEESD